MTRPALTDYREPEAAAAYDIALDYLERSGSMRDPHAASTFVANELSKLIQRGEHNKIRLANMVIARFERRYLIEH